MELKHYPLYYGGTLMPWATGVGNHQKCTLPITKSAQV